jgi:hypothetical protein
MNPSQKIAPANSPPTLLIYLEDAPLANGVAGTGLSKAFTPSLRGLLTENTRICVVQTHRYEDPNGLAEELRLRPSWSASWWSWVFARICSRLPWASARFFAELHGSWIAGRLRHALPDLLRPGTRMLVPIGVDPLTLVRAEAIARKLSADFEPYFVDDLQHHPCNNRWREYLHISITELLHRAVRIYCITDGLSRLLRIRHAVAPRTLNLVAPASYRNEANPSAQTSLKSDTFAFFLGSVNHLYADGLKKLILLVEELRQATQQSYTVRISSDVRQVRAELGDLPNWVVVGPIADDSQMHREIATATFCFLPYSFSKSARDMVESSFPSKLIDYLAHARAIVVFAPQNSVPYRLMEDYDLPYTCSSEDSMRYLVTKLSQTTPRFSSEYKRLLNSLFTEDAMMRSLQLPVSRP